MDDTLVSDEGSVSGRSVQDRQALTLARGTTVGRYVIVDLLGRGAMGVVHAAYDPELDRKIALKLVAVRRSEGDTSIGRSHTLREAQAMARLQHSNTVTVYDVGTFEGHVFLAMEFVAGGTLSEWLRARSRSWREVVDAFVQAGRGLAAAHHAGIIHRDFKPDNVLVAEEPHAPRGARVLVTDFGLARSLPSGELEEAPKIAGSGVDLRLTRTGRIAGTPAYMAPEVISGLGADERSDQFSFCVALYEALYGQRPFEADTLAALVLELTEGRVREPPADARVPAFVRRVVLRGLCVDPDARFEHMDALLQALLDDPSRRLRRVLGSAAIVTLVVAAGVVGYAQADRTGACEDAAGRLRGVWDDNRRTAVENALLATDVVYAADTAPRVRQALDEYADAWRHVATEACLATRTRPDDEMHARRGLCLVRRRAELNALVDVLVRADAAVVERAAQAVGRLGSVDACADPAALDGFSLPQDPELARQVETLRADLDRVRALFVTGQRNEASELAETTLARARALGYEPLVAEALGALGHALVEADPGTATERLREAYWLALGHGEDPLALSAATDLVWAHIELGRYPLAHDWAAHGEALLRRTGGDTRRQPDLDLRIARLLTSEARYEEALSRLQRAGNVIDADTHRVISHLAEMANVLTRQGDYDAAIPMYQEALLHAQQTLGPRHPSVLALVNNLAIVRYEQGDFDGARIEFERALALAERMWGQEHLGTAALLNNLGSVFERLGRYPDALAAHERALAARRVLTGAESLDVAESYNNLGAVHAQLRDLENARVHHQRALEIRESLLGAEHPLFAVSLANLAVVDTEAGDAARGRPAFERALAIQEAVLGADHPHVVDTLLGLGAAAIDLRDWEAAERALERAHTFPEDTLTSNERARLRLLLARALRGRGERLDRALALAEEARALVDDDPRALELRSQIDRFLATPP